MRQSGHFWAELTKHMLILPVWEPSLRARPDEQTPAAVSVTPTCPLTFTTLQTHRLLVGLSRKSPHTDSGELLVTITTSTCRVPGHTWTIQCCNKYITLSCSCPTTAFSCSCTAHQRRTHYDLLIHIILLSNLLSEWVWQLSDHFQQQLSWETIKYPHVLLFPTNKTLFQLHVRTHIGTGDIRRLSILVSGYNS